MKKGVPILLFILLFSAMSAFPEEATLKIEVVTEQANIRLKPDIGSIIISQVPKGTILISSAKEGEWYRIILESEGKESATGYVHQSLVTVISPIPSKERTEEAREEIPEDKPVEIKAYPITPPTPAPTKHLFDLLLSGGIDFLNGGDLNTGAQGLADFYRDNLALEAEGDVKSVRLSHLFGGELSFPLFSNFSLGLGADYFSGKKESRLDFGGNASAPQSFVTRPKIQALPLRICLSFYPFSSFYIKTGVEYYFAECAYLYRLEEEEFWEEHQGEAKAQEFGFLGGFGFEWKIFSPLSLFIEALGHYARITGFEGKNTYRDSQGSLSTEEGKLYFYQGKGGGETNYSLLFVRKNEPAGANVSEVKEAMVDFSGLSLKVGIKIRF
jgi:hypothetical protein